MPQSLEIQIQTLTPLWTGGIDGTCDQLHISGLMGSLRYWYEAIVRGAGGYACDPSNGGGCVYDKDKGTKSICAACYLFGTTGWARLFRLTAMVGNEPGIIKAEEPLHFRAYGPNRGRMQTIFEAIEEKGKDGKRSRVDEQYTIYSPQPITLRYVWRGVDSEYGKAQIHMLCWFLAKYAGFGAKQQFGFGQIRLVSSALSPTEWFSGQRTLIIRKSDFLQKGSVEKPEPPTQPVFKGEHVPPPDLKDFFEIACTIPQQRIRQAITLGKEPKHMYSEQMPVYLAEAFDIRYKGNGAMGLRRFLDARNTSSPYPHKWAHAQLIAFFGASELKGDKQLIGRSMENNERSASRVFVSMPYQPTANNNYRLVVYGFALPKMGIPPKGCFSPTMAIEICTQYLTAIGGINLQSQLGTALLEVQR